MKQKIIFTTIFNVFALFSAGQSIAEVYLFAEKQFEAGNYIEALTEYQRCLLYTSVYGNLGSLGCNSYLSSCNRVLLKLFKQTITKAVEDSTAFAFIYYENIYFNSSYFWIVFSESFCTGLF